MQIKQTVLISLLFFNFNAHAKNYWNSLSPIGEGSPLKTFELLEEYSGLFNKYVFLHHYDDASEFIIHKLKRHTFQLNSKKLYETLPEREDRSRYLHGNGLARTNDYFFSFDSKVHKKLRNKEFGSTQLIYEAKLRDNSIYDMFLGFNFFLKELPYKNLAQSFFNFKDQLENDHRKNMQKEITASFPHIVSISNRYSNIIFEANKEQQSFRTNFQLNVKMNEIEKFKYGYFYRYLKDLNDIFIGKVVLKDDDGNTLGEFQTDSKKKIFKLKMAFDKDHFIPLMGKGKKVDLLKLGDQNFNLYFYGKLNLFDITFDVQEHMVPLVYNYNGSSASLITHLTKLPKFKIVGNTLTGPIVSILKGVFDLDQKVIQFFKELQRSESYLKLTYFNKGENSPENLYLSSKLSILDNTLLKMGFKLISNRILPDENEKKEILEMTKEFHKAFNLDVKKAKNNILARN